jgi:hypothetical protein
MKILVAFLFSASVFAQVTCRPPTARFPVQDQDGLGSCASNTASLLLQHNARVVTSPPSYIHLSIAVNAVDATTFFRPVLASDRENEGRSEVLFNNGAYTCDVLNNAMFGGYCDANLLPMDFINRTDPMQSQRASLESLSRVIDQNPQAFEQFRRDLAHPVTRQTAIRRFATVMMEERDFCRMIPSSSDCSHPLGALALGRMFRDPECPISETIDPQFLSFAQEIAAELTSPTLDPQYAIVSLFSPACARQARTRRIDGMSCRRVLNTVTATTSAAISRELCAGRAVGISVCFEILNAELPVNTNRCQNRTEAGNHAMTIINGQTGSNGKRRLLIQNSWGRSCPYANRPAFNELVTCERDTDGTLTGRFWMDEELLLKNTNSVDIFAPR